MAALDRRVIVERPSHAIVGRVKIVQGRYQGMEGEVVEDLGDRLKVALDIFGRRIEVEVDRADTDAEPPSGGLSSLLGALDSMMAETPRRPDELVLPSMSEALDALQGWMRQSASEIHAAHETASEADLERLSTLGKTEELVALYRRFGGTTDWQSFWQGCELVPPRSGMSSREMMNELENDGTFYRWMPGEWWNAKWLPFLDNHSYDMYCVDLETGEVMQYSKDGAERPALAPSLGAWLGFIVLAVRHGLAHWDADAGFTERHERSDELDELRRQALPGYPTKRAARARRDVEGQEPAPKPPQFVEGCTVTQQWWAPASASVHAIAYLPTRGLLALGQHDWDEAPGGLSLVDPDSHEVVEVVLGPNEGTALELEASGDVLIGRRLRSHGNEVFAYDQAVRVIRRDLPTRMERFIGVGDEAVAIAADPIEIRPLDGRGLLTLDIEGDGLVVALSPNGRTIAVGQRDQPIRWFDVESAALLGHTEESVYPKQIVFGVADDLWVASNRQSRWYDLNTGAEKEHETCSNPFTVVLHRGTGRVALAGYGGLVTVFDARTGERLACDSTHGCRVYGLAWDASGTRLWSAGEGGQVVERQLA